MKEQILNNSNEELENNYCDLEFISLEEICIQRLNDKEHNPLSGEELFIATMELLNELRKGED